MGSKVAVLAAGEVHEFLVVGASLDDGEGLQHPVVEGGREFFSGPSRGDLNRRFPQS